MQPDKITEKIGFRLKKISLIKFFIENKLDSSSIDEKEIKFDIKIGLSIDDKNSIINVDTYVELSKDNYKLCELITRISYEIKELEKLQKSDDKEINLPDIFVTTLISISISTTRGILSEKTKGTFLEGAYLPIVDPKKFVRGN
ncbi:MAG: hypothetical protein QXD05_00125 [Candidatus Pacearchaeota archaeon]